MDSRHDVRPALLDPEVLRRLFRLLEATDVDELEVVHGDARIYVRREPGGPEPTQAHGQRTASGVDEGIAIRAPLTGVYYPRSAPDQPLFVTPGATVEPGQIVALIETMKLFNEVTAELTGEVISVVAQQGDLVEAGQPLMFIRALQEGDHA
jgi:acetyl-CoA carboxylase biotin carboxyl carrier protein